MILIHPGFGISTAWAYQQLSRFPGAVNGRPGRAAELVSHLQYGDLQQAGALFYNSLETPVLPKYPLLALFQDFLRSHGALAVLMSGSGSATFALMKEKSAAEGALEQFNQHFGESCWNAVVAL
jgi:4-diphosphocytidyl-2-C-methyl-D-erythritol kinase